MEKFYSSKALLKMADGGDASPTSPPLGSPLDATSLEVQVEHCIVQHLNQI